MFRIISSLCFFLLVTSAFAEDIKPKFGWPTTGKVFVREKTLKDGNRAVTSYNLAFKKVEEKLHVTYTDYSFLTINGEDVRGHPDIKKVEKLSAQGMPVFIVTTAGHFTELGNYQSLVIAMNAVSKDKEEVNKMMATPQFKKAMAAKAGEQWFIWSEAWSAVSIQGDNAVMNVPTGFLLFDNYNPSTSKVELLGKCSRTPKCYEVAITMNLSAADGSRMIGTATDKTPGGKMTPQGAAVQKTIKAKIDFDTLRPFEVSTRSVGKVKLDGKEKEVVEEHEYFFDWPATQASTGA
jgi:hypothetical protein